MIGRKVGPGRRVLGAFVCLALLGTQGAADGLRRLPDTEVARAGPFSAYLVDPTPRYAHGVLGDAIEAGGFVVEYNGRRLVYRLGEDAVFEDRRVRLADLDGDGTPEAIVVKSYLTRGAAIAVYRILPDRIEPLAESASIGTANRWLNPAGIADFTGDGSVAIAAVVTPHLAGSLRLFRLAGATLRPIARIDGFTNHIIGSRDLDLGRIADIDGDGVPEVILPTLDRRFLAAVSFKGGAAATTRMKRLPARAIAVGDVADGTAPIKLEGGGYVSIDMRPK